MYDLHNESKQPICIFTSLFDMVTLAGRYISLTMSVQCAGLIGFCGFYICLFFVLGEVETPYSGMADKFLLFSGGVETPFSDMVDGDFTPSEMIILSESDSGDDENDKLPARNSKMGHIMRTPLRRQVTVNTRI